MNKYILIFSLLFFQNLLFSQFLSPNDGGEYIIPKNDYCLSNEDRTVVKEQIYQNRNLLIGKGLLQNQRSANNIVLFDWPLKATANLPYNSYYGISNYVDHDPDFSGGQNSATNLDYNCGNRSYDTNGGYNHPGTDFFTWPFPFYMYENNLVEVIAAEAGTIVLRHDGEDDDHCSCFGTWNAVYVEHADGSVAWYGHMKKNSLTAKVAGQSVAKGEYLGVLASSGCSSGPHLHFEVYDGDNNLIDPFAGPCNDLNSDSWWSSQLPYRDMTINALITHDAAPSLGCPGSDEVPNFSNVFEPGESVYTAAYYHDQLVGEITTYTIRRPDNVIWQTWTHSSNATYDASYWLWIWNLPPAGPYGDWTYEAVYGGETVSHTFQYRPYCQLPAPNTWVGPSVGDWNDGDGNWSKNKIPLLCDDVVIPPGYIITVQNNQTGNCNSLELKSGARVNVLPNANLNVVNP